MNEINITSLNLNGKVITEIANEKAYEPENALMTAKGIKTLINDTTVSSINKITNLIDGEGYELTTEAKTIIPAINEINASNSIQGENDTKLIYASLDLTNPITVEDTPESSSSEYRIINSIDKNITLNSNYVKIINWSYAYTVTVSKNPIDLHICLSSDITSALPASTNLHLYINSDITTSLTSIATAENLILHINTPKVIPLSFWQAVNSSGFTKIKIICDVANRLSNMTFYNNTTVTEITANFLFKLKENLFYGCSNLVTAEFEYQKTIPTGCFDGNDNNQSFQTFQEWLNNQS